MFFRSAATFLLSCIAFPAAAVCVGDSYLDQLTPQQEAQLSAAVADMPYSEGLIWTATKDTTEITVVGTMHIYDPRLEELRAQLEELITREPDRLFLVDGPTLPELVDEETWQLILAAASERGIPSFMAAKMQPWYLSMTLAVPSCVMADMMAGARGLDQMIIEDAQAAGVPMQAVEPYTTLFDLFGDNNMDEQISMLRISMLVPELQQQMFVAMLDSYFSQEIGQLWEMSRLALSDVPGMDPDEGNAMFDEMEESMLNIRNRNWIPVITDAAKSRNDIVVAVGAGHLIGEQGVLQLLENEGWTITRAE